MSHFVQSTVTNAMHGARWDKHFTYRSGDGEAVLLCVTVAGLTGDLVFEPSFDFFLLASRCLADLV